MKSAAPPLRRPEEIELKLALPASDRVLLEKTLMRTPALARRQAGRQSLHNIYYDTPDQILHREKVALRLRRVGSDVNTSWLQTLKTGGRGDSALSQRGEWESAVPGTGIDLPALQATPWPGIDPDGAIFSALAPCFVTSFDRTRWTVRKRDGSMVEVSLDIGQIRVGDRQTPICELELELLAGPPAALFALARQLATTIALLPENRSKAERGYSLAQDSMGLPLHARPPGMEAGLPLTVAAQCVLREMFCQFTSNLNTLRTSDDAEVVHQARVGWRRFKSACRLFRPILKLDAMPSWDPLATLMAFMGELRDLDVARTETLPRYADAYVAGKASREKKWQAMDQALMQAANVQRKATRHALAVPAVGAGLLAITQWLEELPDTPPQGETRQTLKLPLPRWARQRVSRLRKQLKRALQVAGTQETQHRVRILAKRLRYGIEALQPLLPRRRAKRWHRKAIELQTAIGTARDVVQASLLIEKLEVDNELVEFLRGIAIGQNQSRRY